MPHSATRSMLKKMSDLKEKCLSASDYIDSDEVLRRYKRFFLVSRLKKAMFIGLLDDASARLLCTSFTCTQVNQKQAVTGVYKCSKCSKGVYIITKLDVSCYVSATPPTLEERELAGLRAQQMTRNAFKKEKQLAKQREQLYEKEFRRCAKLVMLSKQDDQLYEEKLRIDDSDPPSKERYNQSMPAHVRLSYAKNKELPELPGRGQHNRSGSPPPVYLQGRADSVPQRGAFWGQSFSIRKEQEGPTYAVPRRFTRHVESTASFSSSISSLVSNATSSQTTLCSQSEDQRKAIFSDDSMYAFLLHPEYRCARVDIKVKNGRMYF